MKKLANIGVLSLLSLISGCNSLPKKAVSLHATTPAKKIEEFFVEVVPFSTYDPPKATTQLFPEANIKGYVFGGLDFNIEPNERIKIENYFNFKNSIYSIARGLGYSEGEVKNMSPREAIRLACDLVAHKTNYFGTTQDHETISKRDRFVERMRRNLLEIIDDSESPNQQKLNAKRKIEQLKEIEKKGVELEHIERQLRDDPGYMVVTADNISIDNLFEGNEPIVCRHFAEITKGVFFILKNDNPKLSNTWVSSYSDRNHRWNQVTTLTDEGYIISFFDPTWYDLRNEIEGYDKYHFPDTKLLEAQLCKFTGKKMLRPFSNN